MNPNDQALILGVAVTAVALSLGLASAAMMLGAFGAGLWLAR